MTAKASLTTCEYQIPGSPIYRGRIARHGRRKISWRVSVRKMLITGLPMDWKKLLITI